MGKFSRSANHFLGMKLFGVSIVKISKYMYDGNIISISI